GANGRDDAAGIATDAAGNVYISGDFESAVDFDPGPGTFILTGNGADNFIWKLDSAGNFVWAKRFGGNVLEDSNGNLAVDAQGNVYAGLNFKGDATFSPSPGAFSVSSRGDFDGVLIKLNSNGDVIWDKQIGGPGNDHVIYLALDDCGNVHITGLFSQTV